MEPEDVLRRHLELCTNVHTLLIEENSWLKKHRSLPSEEILTRKHQVLPLLDESLASLKKLQPENFSPFGDCKELVNAAHAKLMQIFYLDRENEDLLQKLVEPPADRAQFNRFTNKDEIDEFHGVEEAPPAAGDVPPPIEPEQPPPTQPPPAQPPPPAPPPSGPRGADPTADPDPPGGRLA